jgi:hypothetical protein
MRMIMAGLRFNNCELNCFSAEPVSAEFRLAAVVLLDAYFYAAHVDVSDKGR